MSTLQRTSPPQVRIIRRGDHFLITDDEDLAEDIPPPPLREVILVDDDFDPECYNIFYEPVAMKSK